MLAGGEGTCLHPITLAVAGVVVLLSIWGERRLGNAPEFSLGFLIGELTVLATVALHCFILLQGGESNWTIPALILVVAHLPIAVVEGMVVGFTVSLLGRVRPDILGMPAAVGGQRSVVSRQPSAVSGQRSAVSRLPSAVDRRVHHVVPWKPRYAPRARRACSRHRPAAE